MSNSRPYFHWPTFEAQIQQQMYRSDWGVFVVTMAVCALTAGRVYDGLAVPTDVNMTSSEATNLSLQCYTAAVNAIPADVTMINDYYPAMKASALLASVCLQDGDLKKLVSHLANYFCLSTIHKFHLEAHWPSDLTEIQRQERRRLVSMIPCSFTIHRVRCRLRNQVHFSCPANKPKVLVCLPTTAISFDKF